MQLFKTTAIFNNLALVYLKLNNNPKAEESATKAIEIEPSYKSYLRRAQSRFNQGYNL
jgi:Tfp pilus assembly protein PilF